MFDTTSRPVVDRPQTILNSCSFLVEGIDFLVLGRVVGHSDLVEAEISCRQMRGIGAAQPDSRIFWRLLELFE